MPELHSRRRFLCQSAAIAAGACTSLAFTGDANGGPATRLKVGIVGVDEDGLALARVVRECGAELVAHWGVEHRLRHELAARHPAAVSFDGPREMIDRAHLDGVIVAPGACGASDVVRTALQHGLHVYAPPVGDSIAEARALGELAQRSGLITQLNLRSASAGLIRHIVEPLQSGAIGRIREVVCWSDGIDARSLLSQGHAILSVPMSALGLAHPTSMAAAGSTPPGEGLPEGMVIRYEFSRRDGRRPLRVTWYSGAWAPPYESVDGLPLSGCGALYLGESGQLLDDPGARRGAVLREGESPRALPAPAAGTHQALRDWIAACQGRPQALAGLENSAILTQTIHAGLIAYRMQQPLDWDGPAMCARNCPQADALIRSAIDMLGSV